MTASSSTAREIASAWSRTIEASQESGVQPTLLVGQGDTLLDGLPALSACRRLARERSDLTAPQAWAGGSGLWWSMALLHGVTQAEGTGDRPASPSMSVRYAGADTATVLAAMSMDAAIRQADIEQGWLYGLPAGMVAHLQPQSEPGIIAPWASLPFSVMGAESEPDPEATIDWAAVAALILALCILLLAALL